MIKKVIILVAATLLSVASAFAQCNPVSGTSGPLTWNLIDGTLTISGNGAMPDYSNQGAPWYECRNSIIYANLNNGVTHIGNHAFKDCTSLTSALIPNSVQTIGLSAFNSSGLLSVIIPNSVLSIAQSAFVNCTNLATVTIEDGNNPSNQKIRFIGNSEDTHFAGSHIVTLYLGRDLETQTSPSHGSPFYYNTHLQFVTIGSKVTTINDNSFRDCSNLYSLTFKEGALTASNSSIGTNAFYNCNLNSPLIIPKGVATIGISAFRGCKLLPSLIIPNSVLSIGQQAFVNCTNLAAVTIEDGNSPSNQKIRFIGNSEDTHFAGSQIVTLYLGRDLETQTSPSHGSPFYYNTHLQSVTIGSKVTTINDNSFRDCSNLYSLTFKEGALTASNSSIGTNAFYNCNLNSPLIIPKGVVTIGISAFRGCKLLPSVIIPNSVLSIGQQAFVNCTNLEVVRIEDGDNPSNQKIRFIGNSEDTHFADSHVVTLYLGRDIETQASPSHGSPFYYNSYLQSLTIGDKVTTINANSFNGCTNLTEIISNPCPPPTVNNCNAFNGISKNIPVILKNCDCLTTYQTANCWKDFTNYQCFVPVEDIILNLPTPYTITVGEALELKASIKPNNATNKDIVWSIEDAGATDAKIAQGNILTTEVNGKFKIKATIFNGKADDFTKIFDFNSVLSIADFISHKFNVYPNPTTGGLRIENENSKIEEICIFDIYGRKLLSHIFPMSYETTINISHLQGGLYFVRIQTEAGELIKKVLKE